MKPGIGEFGRYLRSREYLLSICIVVAGMVVAGLIRPLIVFNVLEERGLFYVALLTTGFMLSRAFASMYTGVLIKSRGYRLSGALAIMLWCLSLLFYAAAPPALYPLVRVFEGFSAGLLWPLMQSLVLSSAPRGYRSRAISLYFIAGSIAYNTGVWIGGFLESLYGQAILYATAGAVLATAAIAYYATAPGAPLVNRGRRVSLGDYASVLAELRGVAPLIIVVGGLSGLSLDYIMAYARSIAGYEREIARIMWSYTGYLSLLLSYLVSAAMDRRQSRAILDAIGYATIASLAALSFEMPPLLLYTLAALPRVGGTVFKPVVRGYATSATRDPELATMGVNFLSNLGAAFTPLVIVTIDSIASVQGVTSLGLLAYTVASITAIAVYSGRTHRAKGG